MSLLPENKPKVKDITPKIFLIWGDSMTGKTYLAKSFESPLLLNTDGNDRKVDTPSVTITDWRIFIEVVKELQQNKDTYKTIIIDLVDDIRTLLDNYIIEEYNKKDKEAKNNKIAETIGDIPFGQGYTQSTSIWKNTMMILSGMDRNIIFISHIKAGKEEQEFEPSLDQKYLNITMGRCDLVVRCTKRGNSYYRLATNRRDDYTLNDIKDEKMREIMKTITGAFKIEMPTMMQKK